MTNPKYKNVFMAPDVEHDEPSAKEPLAVNGHTINSKLGGTGRTIAETLRKANRTDGQTIGSALPDQDQSPIADKDEDPVDNNQPGAEK